jgi:hypothetical protein
MIFQVWEEPLLIQKKTLVMKEKAVENEMSQEKARDLDQQVLGTFLKSFSKRYEQWKRGDLLFVALQTLPKQVKKENVLKNLIKLDTEFTKRLTDEV